MRPASSPFARSAAFVALGALIIHQLRYALAYGGDAQHELAAQGHAYLGAATPVVLALVIALLAASLVRAALGGEASRLRPPGVAAAVFGLAIFGTFAAQELAEGLLHSGHEAGIAAVFGGLGWVALPLAAALGGVCALADRLFTRLESLVAPRDERPRRRAPSRSLRPERRFARRLSPLALGAASRPPPAVS